MHSDYIQVGLGICLGEDSFSVGFSAAQQALSQLTLYQPSLVLVYAPVTYDLQRLLDGVTAVTKDAPLVGTSTSGESFNSPSEMGCVEVVILASPYLRVNIGVGLGVENNPQQAIDEAFQQGRVNEYLTYQDLGGKLKVSFLNPYKSMFALIFLPGKVNDYEARGFEIADSIRRKSGNKLPIFGGCSSTSKRDNPTYQLANGKVYTDSLVLALVETDLKFGIAKAHGFIPTKKNMLITKAQDYRIEELDYRPAAEAYANFHSISVEELKKNPEKYFQANPFGVRDIYGRYYLIDADRVSENNGIELYMKVREDSLVAIMETETERIVQSEQKAIDKALLKGEIKNPAFTLLHSCNLRKKLLGNQKNKCMELINSNLGEGKLSGFYSYGEMAISEEGVPMYFNGTAVALVLGNELDSISRVVINNTQLYEEITTLYKVSTTLNSTLQLDEILEKTTSLIKEAMRVDDFCLFLQPEGEKDLELSPSLSTHGQENEEIMKEICKQVLQQGKPIIINHQGGKVKSILAIPLTSKERNIGVGVITSQETAFFSQREVDFFAALANQASMAIENARLYKMMEHSAYTDGLTGLYNHRYFQVRLQEELRRIKRNKSKLSLMMLDIDNFKNYNDTNGHPQGDWVLKELADILIQSVRAIDIVSRYGGEEFSVILPDTDSEDAFSVAERIRKNIEQSYFQVNGCDDKSITVSIGIACYPHQVSGKEELIKKADQALYQAKRQGRNQVCIY